AILAQRLGIDAYHVLGDLARGSILDRDRATSTGWRLQSEHAVMPLPGRPSLAPRPGSRWAFLFPAERGRFLGDVTPEMYNEFHQMVGRPEVGSSLDYL